LLAQPQHRVPQLEVLEVLLDQGDQPLPLQTHGASSLPRARRAGLLPRDRALFQRTRRQGANQRKVGAMATDEERIALFIDHENLVLGARDVGRSYDVGPIFDALAERGRVVARRAYADWTLFAADRRSLVEHNCELIDIPQRTGMVRKNAADIKLAVDAMELAYERGFVSTFVIASGDSDFTPLVAALRALNRRVLGIGVEGSTSALLPPACDEFMFYDRLPGVPEIVRAPKASGTKKTTKSSSAKSGEAKTARSAGAKADSGRKERERGPSTTERDQQ